MICGIIKFNFQYVFTCIYQQFSYNLESCKNISPFNFFFSLISAFIKSKIPWISYSVRRVHFSPGTGAPLITTLRKCNRSTKRRHGWSTPRKHKDNGSVWGKSKETCYLGLAWDNNTNNTVGFHHKKLLYGSGPGTETT